VQRSDTALSCWSIRVGLAHEKGSRRECEELSLAAMASNPRAARALFWNIDATAASAPREKVNPGVERWLALQDAALRAEDEARARALLDVLDGNLGTAARALGRLPASQQSRVRMFRYEPTWLLLLEETGQLDELKEVALQLEERAASELPPTMSSSSIIDRTEPDVMRALLISGARDEASIETKLQAFEASLLARARSLAGLVWVRARAALVESPSTAKRALELVPPGGPPKFLNGAVLHLGVGKTYLLAGRTELARPWLERAAGSCSTLSAPVTWLRAQYWLGRALEAAGERDRACSAYATVIQRWGEAKPSSVTATEARKAASALGCR
jgi:tetratricopeptide (TPR) repeat protein